ncbi:MAG: hypothetical protein CMH57_02560 [Myxococcales bacterium]|nr:hypothetical protein [Myxococcales bacterium]
MQALDAPSTFDRLKRLHGERRAEALLFIRDTLAPSIASLEVNIQAAEEAQGAWGVRGAGARWADLRDLRWRLRTLKECREGLVKGFDLTEAELGELEVDHEA